MVRNGVSTREAAESCNVPRTMLTLPILSMNHIRDYWHAHAHVHQCQASSGLHA